MSGDALQQCVLAYSTAVCERNEHFTEDLELQDNVARLSKEMQEKTKALPEDVKKAITDYIEATVNVQCPS